MNKYLIMVIGLFLNVAAFGSVDSSMISIEFDREKLRYRAVINFERSLVWYNAGDIVIQKGKLSPQGFVAYVFDEKKVLMRSGGQGDGYTSYNSSSDLALSKSFFRIPEDKKIVTEWFLLKDLLRGFDLVSGFKIEYWAMICLELQIKVSGSSDGSTSERLIRSRSEVIALSINERHKLIKQYEVETGSKYSPMK